MHALVVVFFEIRMDSTFHVPTNVADKQNRLACWQTDVCNSWQESAWGPCMHTSVSLSTRPSCILSIALCSRVRKAAVLSSATEPSVLCDVACWLMCSTRISISFLAVSLSLAFCTTQQFQVSQCSLGTQYDASSITLHIPFRAHSTEQVLADLGLSGLLLFSFC